ncbi:hypothetical protein SISSUDRAFT_993965, partial [Sistotremastrum suecicum HHB10207 ss-3]
MIKSHLGCDAPELDDLLENLKRDPRTVLHRLDLEPRTRAYILCPKCFQCYPEHTKTQRCTFKATPSSQFCDADLFYERVIRGKAQKIPHQKYLHQDLRSWIGRFLSRPEIESALHGDTLVSPDGAMRDIWDGHALREFKDSDGTPFFINHPTLGRYAFSLNVDGFNPYHMKTAGKQVTVTAIYMVCLSLPFDLRYLVENVYLAGVIPGAPKPSLQDINKLLTHLVDDLEVLWRTGANYVTSLSPNGRHVRCALIPVVCDMP